MANQTTCAVATSEPQFMPRDPHRAVGYTDISLQQRCRMAASLLKQPRLSVYAIETTFDKEPLTILVADDGTTLPYIEQLTYSEGIHVSKKFSISVFKGTDLLNTSADLVVVGVNRLLVHSYVRHGFRIVPKWVKLILPVYKEPCLRIYDKERNAGKRLKWMIKKTRDVGYECEIVSDRAQFNRFYYEMYGPCAERRFGELADAHEYNEVNRAFESGALAIVKRAGKPLAGAVVCKQGDTLYLPHTGIAEDSIDDAENGAVFALDYYLADYAHSHKFQCVDFGYSRPFFSDEKLRYKLNWHLTVLPDNYSIGMFAVACPRWSAKGIKFLAANPFFEMVEHKIHECRFHICPNKKRPTEKGKLLEHIATNINH